MYVYFIRLWYTENIVDTCVTNTEDTCRAYMRINDSVVIPDKISEWTVMASELCMKKIRKNEYWSKIYFSRPRIDRIL